MAGRKKDNQGFSLVELLVAFAVSAIVLAGLGMLMINVMNMYARTNANVELQNESQTAMNLVIDNVMDATGLCMIEASALPIAGDASNQPVCVLLGQLTVNEADYGKCTFVGDAIIWDPQSREVYIKTFRDKTEGELDTAGAASQSEAAIKAVAKVQEQVLSLTKEEKLELLLARHVTVFDLRPSSYYTFPDAETKMDPDNPSGTLGVHYYQNPMVLSLHMEFEMEYQNGKPPLTREMDEDIAIRNRMPYLYLYRKGGSMLKYICS